MKTEDQKANDYANSIIPDFSDYYNWKPIKDAFLAGYNKHKEEIENASKELIKSIE